MHMVKVYKILASVLVTVFFICGCSTEVERPSPEEVIEEFFILYSQSDLEEMKQYCSEDFVKLYFGDETVLGNTSAVAQKIEVVEDLSNGIDKEVFFVEATISPEKNSALFGEDATCFYLSLITNEKGNWMIDEFFTG